MSPAENDRMVRCGIYSLQGQKSPELVSSSVESCCSYCDIYVFADYAKFYRHFKLPEDQELRQLARKLTGQLADKPTRGQSSRGLDNLRTGLHADSEF